MAQSIVSQVRQAATRAVVRVAVGTAFGAALRALRKSLGLTQAEAARATLVSLRAYHGWERGRAPLVPTQGGAMALLGAQKAVAAIRRKT